MQKMEKFRDSTSICDDGAALKERLDRDGYLFIRKLLPREAIMRVRTRLLEKAAEGGWLNESTPVESAIANQAAACKDPEEGYIKVFKNLWADEELHRLRTHPKVLKFFEGIFEEPALAHPSFVQRNIFPQREDFDFTTQPHQDKVHIGGDTNYAMWVPIGDCPVEKGSLAIAAGSHRFGVLDTKVGSGAGGMDISVPIPGQWVTGSFDLGDALIFCDETVHQAVPNQTNELRQSFDARYQPATHAICEYALDPYAGCGSWEEVYSTWNSTDQQYYWKDFDLKTVPQDRSYYEARDKMAFQMAENGDTEARDALLRIVQRDKNPGKIKKAQHLLIELDGGSENSVSVPG